LTVKVIIPFVAAVESVEEAIDFMARNLADLVILDLCLPGLSYDMAVKAIKNRQSGYGYHGIHGLGG